MKDKLPTTIPLPKRIELAENGKTKKLNAKTDVASALTVSAPSQTSLALNPSDVSQASMFYPINIAEIDFYDHNPRKSHESVQYEELKESIRNKGVLQPVHVTKRYGATHYVLSKGGNTRLKILKELYQETGDAKYSAMPCIYQPFTTEQDLFVGHLIENEKRSEMCFWDRASAYSRLRDEIQIGFSKSLSLRDFAEQFSLIGLSLSYVRLGIMFFAHDKLAVLSTQLSNSVATELRKVYTSLLNVVQQNNVSEQSFADFWQKTLSDWDHETAGIELNINHLSQFISSVFYATFDITPPTSKPSKLTQEEDLEAGSEETKTISSTEPAASTTSLGSLDEVPTEPDTAKTCANEVESKPSESAEPALSIEEETLGEKIA